MEEETVHKKYRKNKRILFFLGEKSRGSSMKEIGGKFGVKKSKNLEKKVIRRRKRRAKIDYYYHFFGELIRRRGCLSNGREPLG